MAGQQTRQLLWFKYPKRSWTPAQRQAVLSILPMNTEGDSDAGICILSFDSGGPGAYSQLLLMKEYMDHLSTDSSLDGDLYPADYFDLMGGVGFGGLAAFMLGHLRMTVDEAIDTLLTVAFAVFPYDPDTESSPETNMENLKSAIGDMLKSRGIHINTKMFDESRPSVKCKVAIYSAASSDVSHPKIFRTYCHRGSSLNPTIQEALCATMAIPSLFSPVKFGPRGRQQNFVGGPFGANNPTRELLKEAGVAFGAEKRVAQIISLGAGMGESLESIAPSEVAGHLLQSLRTDCEMVASELSTRLLNVDAYVRLNVESGSECSTLDDWRGLAAIERHTSAYVETQAVVRLLETSRQYLRSRIGTATLGQINYSSNVRAAVKVAPAVSPYHVIRRREWDIMVQHLIKVPCSTQKIFAITGMGGCGKTQLVSYFLQEMGSMFMHAVFVDASSQANIKADLQAWIRSLDGHERDVWEDALRVLASGIFEGRWILILDNADNPTLDLRHFIPNCYNGTVIITSRNRHTGNLSNTHHLELGEMEMDEALSTLLRAAQSRVPLSPEELSDAHLLIEKLGFLAVALVQAGTYCHRLSTLVNGVFIPFKFAQYASLFSLQRAELMKMAESSSLDNYQLGAYTAFDLSYKAIPQASRDFLHFLSSFHPSTISLSMFSTAAGHTFTDPIPLLQRADDHEHIIDDLKTLLCVNGTWSEFRAHETIRTLRGFSLISASATFGTVCIHLHPLVHAWVRDMWPYHVQRNRSMAIQVLTSCSAVTDVQVFRHLLPHFQDLIDQNLTDKMHVNDQMAAGIVFKDRGNHSQAEELFLKVIEALRKDGANDDVVMVYGWLAVTYDTAGKWDEAEVLKLEILEWQTNSLGEDAPQTLQTELNLGSTYNFQGRFREAESIKLKAIEKIKRRFGMFSLMAADAAAGLGQTYFLQQRWTDLERVTLWVSEIRTTVLGENHPDTIAAAANLAATYNTLGKYEQAEAVGSKVLEQQRAILGRDHLKTIQTASNLARALADQGRWSEAEVLETEVLEKRTQRLGKEHPDTLMAAANLARTLSEAGRHDEAETLELDVLEKRRRLFPDHHYTVRAAANLAITYRLQGRLNEAEQLEVDVITQRERLLGKEHVDTIRAAADLAIIFRLQGRLEEAETWGVKVLEQHVRIMGPRHPNTIGVEANLALTYREQERWEEAGSMLSHAVELSLEVLGQRHPYTQTRIRDRINLLTALGKEDVAKDLERMLL